MAKQTKAPLRQHSLYERLSSHFAPRGDDPNWKHTCLPVLIMAILATLTTGGPVYAFGVYSQALKLALQLSQSRLDTIATVPNFVSGLVSVVPGILIDTIGIRTACTLGGICLTIAYFVYWLLVRVYIPTHHVVTILCLLLVCIHVSNQLIVGSVMKGLVVATGHGSRGYAVGAAKAYIGIGSGVYAILFASVPTKSDLDFILLAGFMALVFVAVPAYLLLPNKEATLQHSIVDVTTVTHYKVVYSGLSILIGLVLWSSLQYMLRPHPHADEQEEGLLRYWKTILILVAWLAPVASFACIPHRQHEYESVPDAPGDIELQENELPQKTGPRHDHTLTQTLQSKSAWLFLWTLTILSGSGIMVTNNVAQMVESLGFSSGASANSLALFSVAQAIARIVMGIASEQALWCRTKRFGIESGVPRTWFVVLSSFLAVIGHLVLAIASTPPLFVIGVILSGAAFGSIWPLTVLVVADVYGASSHGSNYLFFDGSTSAFGALFISKYIVQFVYESHVDTEVDALTCYGTQCFRGAQVIVTMLCISSLFSSAYFSHMTRDCYGQPIAYRFFG